MKRISKIILMLLCCTMLGSIHVVQASSIQVSSKPIVSRPVSSVAQGMLGSSLVPPPNPSPYGFHVNSSKIKRQYMSQKLSINHIHILQICSLHHFKSTDRFNHLMKNKLCNAHYYIIRSANIYDGTITSA